MQILLREHLPKYSSVPGLLLENPRTRLQHSVRKKLKNTLPGWIRNYIWNELALSVHWATSGMKEKDTPCEMSNSKLPVLPLTLSTDVGDKFIFYYMGPREQQRAWEVGSKKIERKKTTVGCLKLFCWSHRHCRSSNGGRLTVDLAHHACVFSYFSSRLTGSTWVWGGGKRRVPPAPPNATHHQPHQKDPVQALHS